jgi:peptide chain release factor subunit 3
MRDLVESTQHKITTKVKKKAQHLRLKALATDSLSKFEHLNIVFIGHVDAGKSTIGGQLLYLTANYIIQEI